MKKFPFTPLRLLGVSAVLTVLTLLPCSVGCSGTPPTASDRPKTVGGSVSVWCPEARDRAEFQPRMTAWANRNGSTVSAATSGTTADVLIIPATEIGRLVVAGELLPVSDALIEDSSAFQWNGLLRVYQSGVVKWGAKEYAVPLVGEGYVLVHRNDRLTDPEFAKSFMTKHSRNPLPIRTWEDLIEIATILTERTGHKSLPPIPTNKTAALTNFCQIAACYDRPPLNARNTDDFRSGLSFLADADTGAPRITSPAFVEAFNWFHATSKFRPTTPGDSIDALVTGTAVAAVVPLADLTRLPRDEKTGAIDGRFGVGSVPGTRAHFNTDGKRIQDASPNFVPYHAGGLVGVVRKSAKSPDACWSLLAELGGPNGSALTIGNPTVGGGPVRSIHVSDGSSLWGQYRFDESRTTALAQAMKHYAPLGVVNPAVGLRTPDAGAIAELIVKQLNRTAVGETSGVEAANQANVDWKALDEKTPVAEWKMWRKRTAARE